MAANCDFLLSCNWLRFLRSPTFPLVRDCFKMFVLFGLNPFYAGKIVPFDIYSLERDINFDKFSSLLVILSFLNMSCLYILHIQSCLHEQQEVVYYLRRIHKICRSHSSEDRIGCSLQGYGPYYTLQYDPLCQGDRFELPEYLCTELLCSP